MKDGRKKNLMEALAKFRASNPMVSDDDLAELVRQSAAFTRGEWGWTELDEAVMATPKPDPGHMLVVMAVDPDNCDDNESWTVAYVPPGYDQDQAISDCLERQAIANACIDWYNERKAEALIEAEPIWPEPQEQPIDRPKWRAGMGASEITAEMRAERDRIDAHNESIRQRSLDALAKRNEHARNRALEQTKGKYPDWAVARAHDKWKSKTNRKYTVSSVRPIQTPNAF